MSVEVRVRYGENIEVVLSKLRRGCLNANILAELKQRQYYVNPSSVRHVKDQEKQRKRKYQKRKEAIVKKYGIESVPRRKKRREFS